MINIENLYKTYKTEDREVEALKNINLEFPDNGLVFLLGKSGSGKTTLLNAVSGLLEVDSGKISYVYGENEYNLLNLKKNEQEDFRNLNLGYIFQDFNLINSCNVEDNISFVLEQQLQDGMAVSDIQKRVDDVINYVELQGMKKSKISELSGGQIQRVAIARALIKKPHVILADEPTGNLDYKIGLKIMELLKDISKECLVIVVTHDESLPMLFGDQIIKLSEGEVVEIENKSDQEINYRLKLTDENSKTILDKVYINRKAALIDLEKHLFGKQAVSLNICCEEMKREERESTKITVTANKSSCGLPARRIRKFANSYLGSNKLRLVANTLGLGMLFGIISFLSGILIADRTEPKAEYVYENRDYIYMNKVMKYKDSIGNVESANFYKTDEINKVVSDLGLEDSWINCYGSVEVVSEAEVTIANIWVNPKNCTEICETVPAKSNEIFITDYLAATLFGGKEAKGKSVEFLGSCFTISGIIKTDYLESGILERFNSGKLSVEDFDKLQYVYQNIWCHKDIAEYLEETAKYISVTGADFTSRGSISYINSEELITSVDKLGEYDKIIWGRLPEKENEIAITYGFAAENGMIEDGNIDASGDFSFQNMYDKKYNGAFMDGVNLYDYFEDFEVVGVVDNMQTETPGDIILYKTKYQAICADYFDRRENMQMLRTTDMSAKDLHRIVEAYDDKGIYLVEGNLEKIDNLHSYKNSLAFIIIGAIILLTTVFFTINNTEMSDVVEKRKKEIGIMKALGVKGDSIHKLFNLQILIMSGIMLVLSIITNIVLNIIFNNILNKRLEITKIHLVGNDFWLTLVLGIVILIINQICGWLALRKLDNKKILELIK